MKSAFSMVWDNTPEKADALVRALNAPLLEGCKGEGYVYFDNNVGFSNIDRDREKEDELEWFVYEHIQFSFGNKDWCAEIQIMDVID